MPGRWPVILCLICCLAASAQDSASGTTASSPAGFLQIPGTPGQAAQSFHASWGAYTIVCRPDGILIWKLREQEANTREASDPRNREVQPRQRLFNRAPLRLRFANASKKARLEATDPGPARINQYLGNDPTRWRTDDRMYRQLRYRGLWPGADLSIQLQSGRLECGLLPVDGVPRDLTVCRESDEIPSNGPPALIIGEADEADLALEHLGPGKLAIDLGPTVNPTEARRSSTKSGASIEWSTLLAGSASVYAASMVAFENGDLALCGYTRGDQFADTAAVYDTTLVADIQVLVCRLAATGNALPWYTLIGGSSDDRGRDLVIDTEGNIIFTALTTWIDYPTTPGTYPGIITPDTWGGVAVTKLDGQTGAMIWSAIIGSGSPLAIALTPAENIVFGGFLMASDYPTTPGALSESPIGETDGFLGVLSGNGQELIASSYIGGPLYDDIRDLQVDGSGLVYITGITVGMGSGAGPAYPVTAESYDPTENGSDDAYLAKVSANLDAMSWGTFLGGTGPDYAIKVCIDRDDNPVVLGSTGSWYFPVLEHAYACTTYGDQDIFVTKVDKGGDSLLVSTRIGGTGPDSMEDLCIDEQGNIIAVGKGLSFDLPTTPGAIASERHGSSDFYVMVLDPTGSDLLWASYIGAEGWDEGNGLALAPDGLPVIEGWTHSENVYTTPGAYDRTVSGTWCVQVMKLHLPVLPVFLLSFTGDRSRGGVELMWELGTEHPGASFWIWRAGAGDERQRISEELTGDQVRYRYLDRRAPEGEVEYWLETQIGTQGSSWFGPVLVPPLPLRGPDIGPGYPNPFNPVVRIPYDLDQAGAVEIGIYDVQGRLVRRLLAGVQGAGRQEIMWDGCDQQGVPIPSGSYFCVLRTEQGRAATRVTIVK